MGQERRREIRFCLSGAFDDFRFYDRKGELQVLPVDVSRTGLALLVPKHYQTESLQEIHLNHEEEETAVTLELRHSTPATLDQSQMPLMRCGFELSEKDRSRGIDLLALIHSSKRLKVRICV